jgi:hypothetical protein
LLKGLEWENLSAFARPPNIGRRPAEKIIWRDADDAGSDFFSRCQWKTKCAPWSQGNLVGRGLEALALEGSTQGKRNRSNSGSADPVVFQFRSPWWSLVFLPFVTGWGHVFDKARRVGVEGVEGVPIEFCRDSVIL